MNAIFIFIDVIKKFSYGNTMLQNMFTGNMKLFRNIRHDFDQVSVRNDYTILPLSASLFLYSQWFKNIVFKIIFLIDFVYGWIVDVILNLYFKSTKISYTSLSQTYSFWACERN
jgi:hypothetical protein